eukprot:COSAG05_NODE_1277_length_5304_cov_5.087992_5_plen_216_part_00
MHEHPEARGIVEVKLSVLLRILFLSFPLLDFFILCNLAEEACSDTHAHTHTHTHTQPHTRTAVLWSCALTCRVRGWRVAATQMAWISLALYWGTQVVKNVVHTTAAGVAAAWYFQALEPDAVISSLKRTLTSSFGSVCFGSLVVAVLQTLRSVGVISRRNNRGGAHVRTNPTFYATHACSSHGDRILMDSGFAMCVCSWAVVVNRGQGRRWIQMG